MPGKYERTPEIREKIKQGVLKHSNNPEHIKKIKEGIERAHRNPHFWERRRQEVIGKKRDPKTLENIKVAAKKRFKNGVYSGSHNHTLDTRISLSLINRKLPPTKENIEKIRLILLEKDKKKPKRRSRGVCGSWYSNKNCQNMTYDSLLELIFQLRLERDPEVVWFKRCDKIIKIPYTHEGKSRKYIPDILIMLNNSVMVIVEVKPDSEWELSENKSKWYFAKIWCSKRPHRKTVFIVLGVSSLTSREYQAYLHMGGCPC